MEEKEFAEWMIEKRLDLLSEGKNMLSQERSLQKSGKSSASK